MGADIGVAGAADGGMRVVGLLHHGAEKAGEGRDGPVHDGGAKVDIAEEAIERIGGRTIGRRAEKLVRHLCEVRRRGDRQILLALEMMKEGPLGEASLAADIVHRGGRIAFGADNLHGGVEKTDAGVGLSLGGRSHAATYQLVCMSVKALFYARDVAISSLVRVPAL